jgi:esterase/lipase
MGQPANLNPSSFNLPGGTTGVLLTHGIPGLLLEMWQPGDYPHARGITVSTPVSPDRAVAVGESLADRVYELIHRRP